MSQSQLIVMLTKNDFTVENAREIFMDCKNQPIAFWGAKEKGLPLNQLKELYQLMKRYGKTTVMEVVAYTKEEGLEGARMAAECGCDILMGTMYYKEIHTFCDAHHMKYMPFLGKVVGRPSVLEGTVGEILQTATSGLQQGVFGFDLLSYRYKGDPHTLTKTLLEQLSLPVCMAGSINSKQRLDEVLKLQPAFFTIGSVFFQSSSQSVGQQLEKLCDYIKKNPQ